MKQKLLSVTVASVLGLGVSGYAQAQAPEGCKAYITGAVVDLRLVNPGSNNTIVPLGAATANGGNNAGIVNGGPPPIPATPGFWDTAGGIVDANQACINGEVADYQTNGPPVPLDPTSSYPCPQNVFPGGNDFSQVGDPVTIDGPFEDFGRSDTLSVPGTATEPGQDVGVDGDDFFLVAGAQRSFTNEFKSANGNLTALVQAVRFNLFPGDEETQTLELRADYSGEAEAIVSVEGSAAAALTALVEIQRVSDGAVVTCNTDAVELAANVPVGPGTDPTPGNPPIAIPPNTVIECDASGFPDGTSQFFQPGVDYDISANFGANANCTLLQTDGDGYKWYFAKNNRSPRLPRPIVTDLVVNDQFGTQTVNVRQLSGLMNPARKNEAGLPDFTDHLSCYLLGRTSPVPVVPGDVRITTENFGEEDVALARGPALCGPAIKTDEDGNSQGNLAGTYYQCYRATGGQPQGAITVTDQFFDEKPHVLTGMSRVCAPVTFGAGTPPPPSDPEAFDHLACYEFPGGSQALNPRIGVEVLDPFMVAAGFGAPGVPVTVEREQRFCEEATKVRLPLP